MGGHIESRPKIRQIAIDRKVGFLMLGVLAVVLGGFAVSEQLTLTTSYPVPSGIYNQLITTGNSGTVPADTTFNRNDGNTILAPNATCTDAARCQVGIGKIDSAATRNKFNVAGTGGFTNLQVNGVAAQDAACTPNGLVARDSTGLLLSCQSLVWKSAGGGGNIGAYTFHIAGYSSTLFYGTGKYDSGAGTFSGSLICDPQTVTINCGNVGNYWCGSDASCAWAYASYSYGSGSGVVGASAIPITDVTQKW